jgi:hypothetical protein
MTTSSGARVQPAVKSGKTSNLSRRMIVQQARIAAQRKKISQKKSKDKKKK